MSRIIEIVLFLAPFLGFTAWRLLFPSPTPPPWLMYGLGGFVALAVITLLWVWHLNASDANQAYIPAKLHNGQVVPAQSAVPP